MRELLDWSLATGGTLLSVLAVVATAGVALLVVRLVRHPPSTAAGRTARDVALIASLAVIFVVTLVAPTPVSGTEPHVRLVPFEDLRNALAGRHSLRLAVAELVGNVMLFVPLGMAARWRWPSLGLLRVGMLALAISATVEILQGLMGGGRWPESTDVITNTIGGLMGAALAALSAPRAGSPMAGWSREERDDEERLAEVVRHPGEQPAAGERLDEPVPAKDGVRGVEGEGAGPGERVG